MNVFNATQIALHALGRNKLRSALTALGIIIGVGSLIALLGIGHGARAQVEAQVASLGENVIQASAGSIAKSAVKMGLGSSGTLTVDDAEAIKEEVPDAVAVSPEVKIKAQVVAGNRNWSSDVYGDSVDYFTIRRWDLAAGETFTEQDVRGAAKVAVIGDEAVEELFAAGKLIRMMIGAARQADQFERLHGPCASSARAGPGSRVQHRQLDVLQRRRAAQQIETLEHEAEFLIADVRQFVVVELRHIHVLQEIPACGGTVETSDEVHESRFSRAAGAEDGHKFTRLDLQGNVAERLHSRCAQRIGPADMLQFD